MKDSTTLKSDFRDWLTLPLTKTFVQILTAQQQKFLEYANKASFLSYHKKEISDQATTAYGKADGIQTALNLMEIIKDEEPVKETKDGEEIITYPITDDLFQQTFEPEND